MAIPWAIRRGLAEETERLANLRTDETGRVDLDALRVDLVAFLSKHPEYLDAQARATKLIENLDDRRRPSEKGEHQLSLFEADAWIPIAPTVRRVMGKAIRDDLASWREIRTEEFTESVIAHGQVMAYIKSRLAAWEPQHETLADLERDKFSAP